MPPRIVAPEGQKFECRDCPARCCRVPWSIRFGPEETERFLADPWIELRVGSEGRRVLARGMLPQREHERRLQCVFLDDDQLCSLQKRYGHEYLPRACQSFPFGFQRDGDKINAHLSQLCPSIRENYGNPVRSQLQVKLRQRGEVERMSTAMSSTAGVILSRSQYLSVASEWQQALAREGSPLDILAAACDRMDAFEQALPDGAERVSDTGVKAALRKGREVEAEELIAPDRPSFHARALHSYLLGNLCYPSRVRQPQRVGQAPLFSRLRSARNKAAWMRGRGTVDLLFVRDPFPLQRAAAVPPFLAGPEGDIVKDYLGAVLTRRNLFARPRYLKDALVDLCFAAVLVSRFARCRAAGEERTAVAPEDVREGISVAELVLLHHVVLAEEGKTVQNLRTLMLSDRDKLRLLLASEA